MNIRAQMIAWWSLPVFVPVFFFGWAILAGFLPPPAPEASATEIAAWFADDATKIRVGLVLAMMSVVLLVPWGVLLALQTGRSEGRMPVMATIQVACIAMIGLTGVIDMCVWAAAAYRPTELPASTVLALNDLGWFIFLFAISPFVLWCAAVGVAILLDRRESPIFPRWSGYLSLWIAFMVSPASLIILFKSGPFAWNGLLALYVPLAVFFLGWMLPMQILLLKAIRRQRDEGDDAGSGHAPSQESGTPPRIDQTAGLS